MQQSEQKPASKYEVILFDLGGVLIELSGISTMEKWTNWRTEKFWRRWLASPTVRSFESGQIPEDEFADNMVQEFSLPIQPDEFLTFFASWPKGAFPGTTELLKKLSPSFHLGCLSNTNVLHWESMVNGMNLVQHLDFCFPSHVTGRLKPDREAFEYVVEQIGIPAKRVLFIDDNQINVEGAKAVGIEAYRADGVEGTKDLLKDLAIV